MAHLPALRALGASFEIAGVANSTRESAEAAARATGLPRAFADVAELVSSPDVDIVAVTVKVPHHHAIVSAALAAGKHVYCEWPLGNGLRETRELAGLARNAGVHAVVGTQARYAPAICQMGDLIADGYVGEILSTTLVGTGMNWGAEVSAANAYTYDAGNGATMLSIPVGHTLAALTGILGGVAEVSATMALRRTQVHNIDTGETIAATAPDQVLANGVLDSGAPISLHYRGGMAHGSGLLWEVNGTEGDLRISGPGGHAQMVPLTLSGGRGGDTFLKPIPLAEKYASDDTDGPVAGNVRRVYQALAQDLANGSRLAPGFDDAVATHRIIAAIEEAARTGRRVRPDSL